MPKNEKTRNLAKKIFTISKKGRGGPLKGSSSGGSSSGGSSSGGLSEGVPFLAKMHEFLKFPLKICPIYMVKRKWYTGWFYTSVIHEINYISGRRTKWPYNCSFLGSQHDPKYKKKWKKWKSYVCCTADTTGNRAFQSYF